MDGAALGLILMMCAAYDLRMQVQSMQLTAWKITRYMPRCLNIYQFAIYDPFVYIAYLWI